MFSSGFHTYMKSIDTADTGAHQGVLTAPETLRKVALGFPISVFSTAIFHIFIQ